MKAEGGAARRATSSSRRSRRARDATCATTSGSTRGGCAVENAEQGARSATCTCGRWAATNIAEWAREFYPVFNRQGLIIDVRHNRGGNIDSWLLGRLLRKAWFYWQPRVGQPSWNMQYAFRGHVVVLVNEFTASDGEAFAEGFRRLGLGKVIGTRTWGGEIWLSSSNVLVDRGIATAAEFGVYGPEGDLADRRPRRRPRHRRRQPAARDVQGRGRAARGGDPHLEEKIKAKPVPVPPAPPYPDKALRPPGGQ